MAYEQEAVRDDEEVEPKGVVVVSYGPLAVGRASLLLEGVQDVEASVDEGLQGRPLRCAPA